MSAINHLRTLGQSTSLNCLLMNNPLNSLGHQSLAFSNKNTGLCNTTLSKITRQIYKVKGDDGMATKARCGLSGFTCPPDASRTTLGLQDCSSQDMAFRGCTRAELL
ncbi:unnamed protein product [Arctogadus glacialis]